MVLQKVGGFNVHACSSGKEALNAVAAIKPDLILLDVIMPDMDGPETFAELRKLPEITNTPIIFMTGMSRPENIASLMSLGALGVIPKPFDPETLSDQVHSIWQKSIVPRDNIS